VLIIRIAGVLDEAKALARVEVLAARILPRA
jgi:hypothetical protein